MAVMIMIVLILIAIVTVDEYKSNYKKEEQRPKERPLIKLEVPKVEKKLLITRNNILSGKVGLDMSTAHTGKAIIACKLLGIDIKELMEVKVPYHVQIKDGKFVPAPSGLQLTTTTVLSNIADDYKTVYDFISGKTPLWGGTGDWIRSPKLSDADLRHILHVSESLNLDILGYCESNSDYKSTRYKNGELIGFTGNTERGEAIGMSKLSNTIQIIEEFEEKKAREIFHDRIKNND